MKHNTNNNRIQKVNEEIRKELSDIIRFKLKDPSLGQMISVIRIETSSDIKHANVYISVLGNENEKQKTIETLKHASGFIKKELGSRLKTYHTPDLSFIIDESIEYGFKISDILDKLKK